MVTTITSKEIISIFKTPNPKHIIYVQPSSSSERGTCSLPESESAGLNSQSIISMVLLPGWNEKISEILNFAWA